MSTTKIQYNRWYAYWGCPVCGGELAEIPDRAAWICTLDGGVVRSRTLWKAIHRNASIGILTSREKLMLEEEHRKPTTLQPE